MNKPLTPEEQYKQKLAKAAREALAKRDQQRTERALKSFEFLDFRQALGPEIKNVSIGK